jgi:hypothetical protein
METKTINLPDRVYRSFLQMAENLLSELSMYRQEIVLVPAPQPMHDGHMIRMPTNQNPYWWSNLYNSHPCKLDRKSFIGSLNRIKDRCDDDRKYDCFTRQTIKNFCVHGIYGGDPDNTVKDYFEE